MRHLSWLLTAPLALVVLSFAVSNRQEVVLSLWPLPFLFDAPAFALVLVSLVAGFVAGGFTAWAGGRRHRRAARAEKIRAAALERELDALRARATGAAPANQPESDARVKLPAMLGRR
ncbi:MAG TPA: LapA family protein [Azospirillaceae bacterium]|nr:LapA family protein [Azospirillaceae bacterium]